MQKKQFYLDLVRPDVRFKVIKLFETLQNWRCKNCAPAARSAQNDDESGTKIPGNLSKLNCTYTHIHKEIMKKEQFL